MSVLLLNWHRFQQWKYRHLAGMRFCIGFEAHASTINDHIKNMRMTAKEFRQVPLHMLDLVVQTDHLVDVQFRGPNSLQEQTFDSRHDGRVPLHKLVKSSDNFSKQKKVFSASEITCVPSTQSRNSRAFLFIKFANFSASVRDTLVFFLVSLFLSP